MSEVVISYNAYSAQSAFVASQRFVQAGISVALLAPESDVAATMRIPRPRLADRGYDERAAQRRPEHPDQRRLHSLRELGGKAFLAVGDGTQYDVEYALAVQRETRETDRPLYSDIYVHGTSVGAALAHCIGRLEASRLLEDSGVEFSTLFLPTTEQVAAYTHGQGA